MSCTVSCPVTLLWLLPPRPLARVSGDAAPPSCRLGCCSFSLRCRSLAHFELIFVCGGRGATSFLCLWGSRCPSTILEKTVLSTNGGALVGSVDVRGRACSGSVCPVGLSVPLVCLSRWSVCPSHCSFRVSLEIRSSDPPDTGRSWGCVASSGPPGPLWPLWVSFPTSAMGTF